MKRIIEQIVIGEKQVQEIDFENINDIHAARASRVFV